MLLRWLVSNYVRQAAEQKLREVASQSAQEALTSHAAPDGEESPPPPPCEVGLVFALGIESGGLVDLLSQRVVTRCPSFLEYAGFLDERRVVVVDSGVGRQAAGRATQDLIAIHQPRWIISAGFAGALQQQLRRGDLLMADTVVDQRHQELRVGLGMDPEALKAAPRLHLGRLLTVDQLIRSPQQKLDLAAQHNAVACDMETMAVAEICRREKVRFLSVRLISDAVDDRLPPEVERLIQQTTWAAKLGAATGALFKRPSSVKDMWKLREDAIKASDRLARFLTGIVAQLM